MSAMPKFAMTYVVVWADERGEGRHVLKVGRAWRFARVQEMAISGGQVVVLARGTDASWETEALRILRRWFPQAFRSEIEARQILFQGRGWTECFEVDDEHLQLAIDLVFEGFAKGSDQGVNEERAAADQRGGYAVAGVPARTARGETDRGRVVDDGDGPSGPVRAGAGADRRGDLPGAGGDGSRDRASADARRLGLPDDLSGAGLGVDRVAAPAARRRPTGVVGCSGTATRTFANIRGCGGSGRAGGCAGACRAGRTGESVGDVGGGAGDPDTAAETTAAYGCPTYRMPRSPLRKIQGLRSLRHRAPASRSLGSGGPLWRADDRVRAEPGSRGGVG
ncbi:hypothetical protein RS84_00229 [Microbacterium hydrocarbonoxydans]|uniref:Uncharacterized protein n=1 Tax=Microbacterium hydrocarbonoxydans TaxID=273678 RepID=A0A0M2HS37_9MICO|nr:hypothetical protein RS84_00229 [Microbacterium hydrocarbonoxydans]